MGNELARLLDAGEGSAALNDEQLAVHAVALPLVLEWVSDCQDVVSAGQVCRAWRRAARDEYLWRGRHAPNLRRDSPSARTWSRFWRVVRFAPRVHKMSVEQPTRNPPPWCQRQYERLGDELNLEVRGLRVRFELHHANVAPAWLYKMIRRLAPRLRLLEVENPGPEDAAVIRSLLDDNGGLGRAAPLLRTLHCRTWTDKLAGVEAWPAGPEPALDVLHASLIFAGAELVRVFGCVARRLELEVNTPGFRSDSSSSIFERLDLRSLAAGHVREVVLLRDARCVSGTRPHDAEACRRQEDRVRRELPLCTSVLCSACERRRLCRCHEWRDPTAASGPQYCV